MRRRNNLYDPPMHVPVLIAGGGPVGLTLGIDLAHRGIPALLCEERGGPTQHPKATLLGARSMELFRRWGLDEAVYDACIQQDDAYYILFTDRLAGYELARFSSPSVLKIRARDPATLARPASWPGALRQDADRPAGAGAGAAGPRPGIGAAHHAPWRAADRLRGSRPACARPRSRPVRRSPPTTWSPATAAHPWCASSSASATSAAAGCGPTCPSTSTRRVPGRPWQGHGQPLFLLQPRRLRRLHRHRWRGALELPALLGRPRREDFDPTTILHRAWASPSISPFWAPCTGTTTSRSRHDGAPAVSSWPATRRISSSPPAAWG